MDTNEKPDLSSVIEGIDFTSAFKNSEKPVDQINFWLPKGYKTRYTMLQARSNKNFGKLVQEVIKICIDRAEASDPKAS